MYPVAYIVEKNRGAKVVLEVNLVSDRPLFAKDVLAYLIVYLLVQSFVLELEVLLEHLGHRRLFVFKGIDEHPLFLLEVSHPIEFEADFAIESDFLPFDGLLLPLEHHLVVIFFLG